MPIVCLLLMLMTPLAALAAPVEVQQAGWQVAAGEGGLPDLQGDDWQALAADEQLNLGIVEHPVWLKYTGPDTSLSFAIMIDILLMVVIGGMGTMWGAVIGAVLMILAQYYLRDLMGAASEAMAGVPLLPELLAPDRWLFWLGIIFILLVYFFPRGITGTIMQKGART